MPVDMMGYPSGGRALFICPHYRADVKNGANSYCGWVSEALSRRFEIDCIDAYGFHPWGKITDLNRACSEQSAIVSSLRSILLRTNYFSERLVPRSLLKVSVDLEGYDLVVVSFIHTHQAFAGLLQQVNDRTIVLTHNYDIEIFERWISGGGLRALVAKASMPSYLQHLRGTKATLAHISESDHEKYRPVSNTKSIVVGPTVHDPTAIKSRPSGAISLAFLGSLATPFNYDALDYFAREIEPALKSLLQFNFHVFGSSPTDAVVRLATSRGWTLHADLDDIALDKKLAQMTAGIMPFQYSQGVKLKAYHYFSVGLPVIATSCLPAPEGFEDGFLSSDDVMAWKEFACRAHAGEIEFTSISERARDLREASLRKIVDDISHMLPL